MTYETKRAITNELIPPFSEKRKELRKKWNQTEGVIWIDFLLDAALTPPKNIPDASYMLVTASAENIKKYMHIGYKLKYAHRERGAITGYFTHQPSP